MHHSLRLETHGSVLVCRFCGERMDIWLVRFAEHAPMRYHGLDEVAHCKTEEALDTVKSICFLDGGGEQREKAILAILQRWPKLLKRHTAAVSQQRMTALFEKLVGPGNPSSGWQGMSTPELQENSCRKCYEPVSALFSHTRRSASGRCMHSACSSGAEFS